MAIFNPLNMVDPYWAALGIANDPFAQYRSAVPGLSGQTGGALGAEEGWIRGTLMVAAPNGGCARVPEGIITTSPHRS